MVSLLSEMARSYVTPALTTAGWRKTGTSYRVLAPNSDQAVITLRRSQSSVPGLERFFVEVGLWPEPYIEMQRHQGFLREANPPAENGLFWSRIRPSQLEETWELTSDSWQACGRQLGNRLVDEVAPMLVRSLDRQLMKQWLIDFPPKDVTTWIWRGAFPSELALIVDDGPSPRLNELLAEAKQFDPDETYSQWVHDRLARRANDSEDRGPAQDDR